MYSHAICHHSKTTEHKNRNKSYVCLAGVCISRQLIESRTEFFVRGQKITRQGYQIQQQSMICQDFHTSKCDFSSTIFLRSNQVLRDLVLVQLIFFLYLNNSRIFCEVLSINKEANLYLTYIRIYSFSRLLIIKIGNPILFSFVLNENELEKREQVEIFFLFFSCSATAVAIAAASLSFSLLIIIIV